MKLENILTKSFDDHMEMVRLAFNSEELMSNIIKASDIIVNTYKNNGKVLICGNGGSAADSQHISGELVSRFRLDRKSLHAEALTVDSSIITSIGNDYSYDEIFSKQVEGKGRDGDVLIVLTTSGKSKNILLAVSEAHKNNMKVISLTGETPSEVLVKHSDIVLKVPSTDTPRVQELHILMYHIMCEYIESSIFS